MLYTEISGVHAPVDDKLKRYIRRRIGGLDMYVPRRVRRSARVEVRLKETGAKDQNQCTCEVLLHVPEESINVSETTVNMYAAVDIAQEKLKHRLRAYKEKHQPSKLRHRIMRRARPEASPAPELPAESE